MDLIKFTDFFICLPDRGQTSRLGRHYVDSDTEIRAQFLNARSDKFHYFIVYIAIFKCRPDDRQRHILRTNAFHRLAVQINTDHSRHLDIISLVQKLFDKLRTALAHRHRSERTVTGMAVGTEDHLSSACKHLSCILMDDCLMRRNIYAAVFLCASQSKHMVIFIDRTAARTKRVVTVCQHIRDRELLKT